MKILITDDNTVLFAGTDIVLGDFQDTETSPIEHKYAIYDGDEIIMYAFPQDGFSVIMTSADLPLDFMQGGIKYKYINDKFVINPNWQPPEEPVEVRLNRLEEAMAELAEMMFGGEL